MRACGRGEWGGLRENRGREGGREGTWAVERGAGRDVVHFAADGKQDGPVCVGAVKGGEVGRGEAAPDAARWVGLWAPVVVVGGGRGEGVRGGDPWGGGEEDADEEDREEEEEGEVERV